MASDVSGKTFDYIIVGGGSAGCVLANRLSEDPKNSVCLIEAGPKDRHPFIHIPAAVVTLIRHKTLNWCYNTVKQINSSNRSVYIPRGRALGGSSSINGMIYMRGHPFDFDDWAAMGNPGWGFKDVLPYFKKSENNETRGGDFHGKGGLLNVSELEKRNELTDAYLDATDSLQLPRRDDFNAEDNEGFGYRQLTIKQGRRHSTAVAFLKPALNRANLTVVTDGLVNRVLLDGKRAVGIELKSNGAMQRISCAKEVILTSGAVGSPMILLRSGIGPASEIAKHGLPVLHELPGVGRNFHDHQAVSITVSTPTTASYAITFKKLPWIAWNILRYGLTRRGFLAGNMIEGGGFTKTDPRLDRTDMQFGFMPGLRKSNGSFINAGYGYTLAAMMLRPKSRGTVTLSGPNPEDGPLLDPNFFAEPEDIEVMLKGVKTARRMLEAPAFAKYGGQETKPGKAVQTDDELRQFIRDTASTVYHPAGTCKMGPGGDAVVDAQLRVHGIAGLRVVDASIMPVVIGGNTNAPTIMIAEKGADMILGKPALPPANVAYGRR